MDYEQTIEVSYIIEKRIKWNGISINAKLKKKYIC